MQSIIRRVLAMGVWLLAITPVQAAPAPAPAPAPKPSIVAASNPGDWATHDVTVRLRYLPRHYSCDNLWDRFHDLLVALGAQPDMKIEISECTGGEEGSSPRVHLRFSMPRSVTNTSAGVREAGVRDPHAAPKTLRLAPGQLGSWTRNDCELMRQIKDSLLPQATVKVVAFSLACAAAPVNSEHYSVVVQAIEPARGPSRVADAR